MPAISRARFHNNIIDLIPSNLQYPVAIYSKNLTIQISMGSLDNKLGLVDLSHHINVKSKSRHPSPLKDIIRYMSQDGMISLAGGVI